MNLYDKFRSLLHQIQTAIVTYEIFITEHSSAKEMKVVTIFLQETDEATREHNELEALDALLQISQINMVNVEPEPDPQIKQLKGMDFDLNLPHYAHHTDEYMLNGNIGLGISIDLNVAAEGIDPEECSKTKMEKSHAAAIFAGNLNGPSACGWLDQEEETPTQHRGGIRATLVSLNNNISERFCGTNRNPADFTPIAAWNPYMREKKDKVPKEDTGENRSRSYSKQNKKP
ncbi:hypothetical protein V8G54_035626 [Vigna mungo]|uniref:Uncharacterized protein n=1 Tax=Vigna mungo TaxID=3915 RepID=A0AAQ3MFE4_VIGMU